MNDEIIRNLNDKLDVAFERGREMLADEDIQMRIQEIRNQAEDTVRANPVKSVLLGLAVGFLIGKAFTSNED
ncbi:hypothetical protein [Balneola vulgaris]|jgi:ElaB/YqjD/DUF883 family membrane-anchored ribosome-binding protein|uniref:hypothetical protein n=1 Tax=Balneola vulgaris TaxID=287535 RepID=UPI000381221F|nr:hypothetical protein [Balneola vulgaris]